MCLILFTFRAPPLAAQQPRLPVTKLAADMVWVKRGPKLYGALVERDEAGNVRMLVARRWLKKVAPDFLVMLDERERASAEAGRTQLLRRITAWRESRKDDVGMRVFLDAERERLSSKTAVAADPATGAKDGSEKEDTAEAGLIEVEVLADEIRSAYAQPVARRQLMLAALRADVERAITMTPEALARELEARRIDWRAAAGPTTKLGKTIDDDDRWAMRQALVEYRHRQPLNFQGSGSFLARTGKGADKPPLEEVLVRVMKDQLEDTLRAALGGPAPARVDWRSQATRVADAEKFNGFRVARLDKDPLGGRVTVTISFHARLPDDRWVDVFQVSATKSIADVKKESLDEIAGADDVKTITALLRGAGSLGGEDALRKALGFGAAAKEALNEAQLKFVTVLKRNIKRLDTPLSLAP